MKLRRLAAAALLTAAFLLPLANAHEARAESFWAGHDKDYLNLQVGVFHALGSKKEAVFGAEYRAGLGLSLFHPFVGIFATHKGSVYGYGGILADIPVGKRIFITPSAAIGGYHKGGGGRDLGGILEFRTGIEVSYRFDNDSRLGASFTHISNADVHSFNPGTEIATINYAIPLRNLFGK